MHSVPTPRQLSLKVSLQDDATFENFYLPSPQSSGALAAAQLRALLRARTSGLPDVAIDGGSGVGSGPGTAVQDFVWLWGGVGAGCSHLLQAVCHTASDLGLNHFYLDLSQTEDLQPDVFQGLEFLDLVCLDHLPAVIGQPEWELALFNLYNRMAQQGCALVMAADRSPQQCICTLPDLHSRLQAAAVFHLKTLDDRHKAAALQMRAQRRGLKLPDEVADYIVRRSERSMRSLFGILQTLDSYSLETQRRLTIPLIRELMGW